MTKITLPITFTIFTSTDPQSKIYTLENEKIKKTPSAQMYRGTAERITIPFKDFANALSKATNKQAFGYGSHNTKYPEKVKIVIRGKEQIENDILSRSKRFYKYRKRPGILMLDYDRSYYDPRPTVTPSELIEILAKIDPNIAKAAKIIRGSVSAGVHLAGKEPEKSNSFHIYIPVKDASDIPVYGKLLFDYLWLNGYGYIALSESASMMPRSLIDAAVFSGERIDFVGQPIVLSKKLEYTELQAKYIPGQCLNTFDLQDLDEEETGKINALIAKAKKLIEPAHDKKRAEYIENKISQMIEKTGASQKKATVLVKKILTGQFKKLWGEWILEFPDEDVTVADVLENYEKYDERSLADPVAGRKYGKSTAKFWWNNGKPVINSFAHGEDTVYFLYKDEPEKKLKRLNEQFYNDPEYQTKEEAYAEMEKAAKQWMKNPKGHFAISAPAGIGKTKIILKHVAIEAANGKFIEIYVPRHDLANQLKGDLLSDSIKRMLVSKGLDPKLNVVVIRGRTKVGDSGEEACKKSELVNAINNYGYNIYKSVCKGDTLTEKKQCEFFEGEKQCAYLEQFRTDTQVRIFTHTSLPLRRSALDKKIPDLAIIDEGFFTAMIDNHRTSFADIECFIENTLLVSVICDSFNKNKPLLANLKREFGDDVVTALKDASQNVYPILPELTSTTKASDIKPKLVDGIKKRQGLAVMLNQLKAEIENFPRRKHSTTVRLVNGEVVIANRHELVRFSKKDDEMVPVLCIDADYCPRLVKVFLPGITRIKLSVERNAYITQIHSTTNAKTRFIPRNNSSIRERESALNIIKDIQVIIDNVCADYGPVLIISYQYLVGNKKNNIEPKLVIPKGSMSVHFGALRGLNEFGHLNTAIIIGRNELPIDAVEAQAAAIWWDRKEELVLTGERHYEDRAYRLRNGKDLGVAVTVCEDEYAQIMMHLQRECESLQAIDRLRLIHNSQIKNVFLLSNVPLDLTVDNLISFTVFKKWKTKIEKALMLAPDGILPLSERYLVEKYPHLFKNNSSAKNELTRTELGKTIEFFSKNNILLNKKEYNLTTFRIKGEKGGDRKVLSPKRMRIELLKRYLKSMFTGIIEIRDSTIPKGGIDNIKPNPSDLDDTAVAFFHHKKFDPVEDRWYVEID